MCGWIGIEKEEAEEIYRIFRNIATDAHYCHHPKKDWPLYDKLARSLGHNTLAEHNEMLRLRDEEETEDERREAVRYEQT